MLGLEPPVQREDLHAEIDGEEPMMQIVEVAIRSNRGVTVDDHPVEAGVPDCRTDAGVQEVEDRMEGAGWNDPVEENAREIEEMLDGCIESPDHGPTLMFL